MKVREALEQLAKRDPNEEICFVYFARDDFWQAGETEPYTLTPVQWQVLVMDFDNKELCGELVDWIQHEISEYIEINKSRAYEDARPSA